MTNVYLSLEKSIVTYVDTVKFFIDASFNSLTTNPGSNIQLICFLPDTLDVTYHTPSYPVQSITESPAPNGTNLTFDLVPLTEAGVSFYFDLYATFKTSTPNNTQAAMTVTVLVPGEAPQIFTSPTVTLSVTPHFIATQTIILPNVTGGAAGDIFAYDIILENIGDPGAAITQLNLSETLPPEFSLATDYTITGLDISDNRFADPRADGITGTRVDSQHFTFLIPAYKGTKYRIRFKGSTLPGLATGNTYNVSAAFSYTSISLQGPFTVGNTFQIQPPAIQGKISLYTPDYTRPGLPINTTCSISNTGNTALQSAVFHINNISSG
ncbi:MAG: hypothetical protein ACRCWY_07955, partial [Cellulosilyticaceae bacterium]